jgi:acyl carrier protein
VQSEEQIVERIVQLFAQELGVSPDAVGSDTHFLFTGGDSLNAESLVVAVAAEFSLRLKTAVLLDAPTPRALARVVMARLAEKRPA